MRQRIIIPKYEKVVSSFNGVVKFLKPKPKKRMVFTLIFGKKHYFPFEQAATMLYLDWNED